MAGVAEFGRNRWPLGLFWRMLVGSEDGFAVLCKRKSDPRIPPSEVLASATWEAGRKSVEGPKETKRKHRVS